MHGVCRIRAIAPRYRVIFGVLALPALLLSFATEPGSAGNLLAVGVMGVLSRLAIGNLVVFFAATAVLAFQSTDFHADDMIRGALLPLYGMIASGALICYLVVLFPSLASRHVPGATGAGGAVDIDSGGCGGGGDGGGGG